MLSRKGGSSEGILERMFLGGSLGRYVKWSLDSEVMCPYSCSKQSKLELRFLSDQVSLKCLPA